ncbi:MAG: EAL domain-containing protein [Ruminococcaceae bacterium]|nr:EAL domain-containing protein [Oscillospiraceae bacterium]
MAGNLQDDARIALDIVEHSPSVAMRVSGDNGAWVIQFITSNVSMFGYRREDFLSGKLTWADVVYPEDLGPLCDTLDSFAARGIDDYNTSYRVVTSTGSYMWVQDHSTVARDAAGNVLYTDCVISDQTSMVQSQEKAEDNLRQQQVLNDILQALHASDMDEAFRIILDRTGVYLDISRVILFEDNPDHTQCSAIYEWCNQGIPSMLEQGEFTLDYKTDIPDIEADLKNLGLRVVDYGDVPERSNQEFTREGVIAAAIFSVYQGSERYGFICFDECVQHRRWEEDTLAFLRNVSKLVSTALVRKKDEEAVIRMAYHDQLTGLANGYRFDHYLGQAIEDARADGRYGYVLFIDMDDFKIINEGYGHDYGDALLVRVAQYLEEQFGESCRLFRFGGDEFTVLVSHHQAGQAMNIVDAILARAQHPWFVMDREFYCTISIGVVRYPEADDGVTEVIKNADIAMYGAKNQGKNSFVVYNRREDNDSLHRAETERRLRDAIENGYAGFQVYYQPLVNIDGEITGAEALIRWQGEDGRMISPGDFIPLAEYLGLIVPLGEFVLQQAALTCQRINTKLPNFSISVNVSIRQFQQRDFLTRAEQILRQTGVDFSRIVLEATEGMVMEDIGYMKLMMEELHALGLRIAMDDFGTGYSSLSNMRELPLDIVKIDRAFIQDIATDAYSKTFVRLITDLCHSMGRAVCVEGVETAEQYRYCTECQTDTIQGYYFYKPMPKDDMMAVLFESEEKNV